MATSNQPKAFFFLFVFSACPEVQTRTVQKLPCHVPSVSRLLSGDKNSTVSLLATKYRVLVLIMYPIMLLLKLMLSLHKIVTGDSEHRAGQAVLLKMILKTQEHLCSAAITDMKQNTNGLIYRISVCGPHVGSCLRWTRHDRKDCMAGHLFLAKQN